jgi:hypothetical protein
MTECRGAVVTPWEYTVSLGQLTLRITRLGERGNLHLVFNTCTRIEMATAWGDADLRVEIAHDGSVTLTDVRAKCRIEAGLLRIFRDVEPLYLQS